MNISGNPSKLDSINELVNEEIAAAQARNNLESDDADNQEKAGPTDCHVLKAKRAGDQEVTTAGKCASRAWEMELTIPE